MAKKKKRDGSKRKPGKRGPIAVELAKKQREISVAEFFEKNRHLLGFDNKKKALLTTIKEAVDNALDACEDAGVLPEVSVEIINMTPKQNEVKTEIKEGQTTLVEEEVKKVKITAGERFRVIVEDNGPGVVKKQIPNIFARLLYGSKFHTLKQSRGQQGIGISAAALYGQLTTGRPVRIISRISPKHPAHYYELKINTKTNEPQIINEKEIKWDKEHGTKIELDLEATYQKAGQSVDTYLKQTAIVNPHVTLIYTNPFAEQFVFSRVTELLPKEPKVIKPHPYGVELGRLIKMAQDTKAHSLSGFLQKEFSRVGSGTAKTICENASLLPGLNPKKISREQAEKLYEGIQKTKLIAPPTNCISPIGAELLEKSLKKEIKAEFYCAVSRPPSVYRGNPFQIEVGCAYGGEQKAEQSITLLRFANRVPLLYQQGACSITKSITGIKWSPYGLSQSRNSLPTGPCTIVVHMASVWVPFTSESKEAVAHYPEIIKEIKLALQECGRKLSSYIHKRKRIIAEGKKRDYIETYIPYVSSALQDLLKLKTADKEKIEKLLKKILEKKRGVLEDIKVDVSEFEEEFALKKNEEEEK
ncbi:DNA topoisomerase VI subunit B [Candidatus Woesearchaeota archaeon]|nr:DNA topoisomerase VI subunit B [Candidatus Woesearchaeota archaeon]